MANNSNFVDSIQQAGRRELVGPNVISNAMPYLGGALLLTAVGTYGGLGIIQANPSLFMPLFWGALITELILFFVARGVAEKENNAVAIPLLALYSLLSGFTLTVIILRALQSAAGVQGIGLAALGCGVAFIAGKSIGSNLSDQDGLALMKTVQIGLIGLVVALVAQLLFTFFGGGFPTFLQIGISAAGVLIFSGLAVVDFYVLPRTYRDEQYLSAALSMYLTYINLFIFLLRLITLLSGGRD
ncbi:Bax inhibitor-1 family protein [Spirulina sp. CS-785/01]|uniref:Bax inhibitor-1/YccA family protein n=1 Tax=Spirulina sp. CS-785/01 TaxID=3021716 RepID=UPI00232AC213|nr:Bax inhibitor-1 family protein [Spirulina sp. CS-785/01]MDB9314936.1 Bax inhibitor-1 family protein [Spirulina sp. CS-785/01]